MALAVEIFVHDAYVPAGLATLHGDAAVDRGRARLDDDAVRRENPVRFTKGMDHALTRYSSERPGEDCDVEGLVRELEPRGISNPIMDA